MSQNPPQKKDYSKSILVEDVIERLRPLQGTGVPVTVDIGGYSHHVSKLLVITNNVGEIIEVSIKANRKRKDDFGAFQLHNSYRPTNSKRLRDMLAKTFHRVWSK